MLRPTYSITVGGATVSSEDWRGLVAMEVERSKNCCADTAVVARRCGFDLYTTPKGALVFGAFVPRAPDATFRFGVDVVSASIERTVPPEGVTVVPESPSSGQGSDTASWLVKDSSSFVGQSGDS